MPSILPSMSVEEALDVTKIYSVSGLLPPETPLIRHRPFRAPHHTISHAGLVGGGRWPRPGEISLAHHGVSFRDVLPEFGTHVLDLIGQPLEDKIVSISPTSTSKTKRHPSTQPTWPISRDRNRKICKGPSQPAPQTWLFPAREEGIPTTPTWDENSLLWCLVLRHQREADGGVHHRVGGVAPASRVTRSLEAFTPAALLSGTSEYQR